MAQQESESARSTRLLIETAKSSTTDLYALLSLPSPFLTAPSTTDSPFPPTTAQLKKAWRTSALKHHPDKNPGHEEAAATKLDEIRKAFDILSHPEARAAYDDKLRARFEKQAREAAFQGKRRRMAEELEARESAGKARPNGLGGASGPGTPGAAAGARFGASSTGSPMAGQKRRFEEGTAFGGSGREGGWMHKSASGEEDAELRRIAAEGARRRQEREDKMRREREDARMKAEEDEEDLLEAKRRTAGQAEAATPTKKFTFSTPHSQKSGIGVGTGVAAEMPSSAPNKSLFHSTMERLKEAQRIRQSGQLQPGEISNEKQTEAAAV